MGKLNNGYLGGFSGTLGPTVGSSWKGIPIIRSRPPQKRGKSSEAQLRQIAKFKLMMPFIKTITPFLNKTYHSNTAKMSCFNKALSLNMRNAIAGEYPEFRVNYPRVMFGIGDLLNPEKITADSVSPGVIRFTWTDNSGEGSARATDTVFVSVYCEVLKEWVTCAKGSKRNAGSYTLDVTAFSGKAVQTYIGFLSADEQFVSTSLYAGLVNIL